MIGELCGMTKRDRSPAPSLSGPLSDRALRAAVPGAALCAFGGMAALWVCGFHRIYFGLLNFLGVAPFRFPFLDIEGVLSAAQCSRYGIDVHFQNPCDALGRTIGSSPLWLAIAPHWLGAADAIWVGALIDIAFLASLALVIRPRSLTEVTLFGLAVFSTATMFALERANIDLILFMLILYGSAIDAEAPAHRAWSYLLYLIGGLLKYYPLALLILLVQNSLRAALVYGGAIFSIILVFIIYYSYSFTGVFANFPQVSCYGNSYEASSYFGYTFGAKNLPFGIACMIGNNSPILSTFATVLLFLLIVVAGIGAWQNLHSLEAVELDWTDGEMYRLTLGSILIAACFAASTNNVYREIYFLFVIPGLVRLRAATTDARLRRWCSWLIAVILLLMWEQFIRLRLADTGSAATWFAAWFVYQLLWWWLVAALAAIALSYLRRQPLSEEGMAALRRLRLR